jgi:transcriptional regulator with XRE-family HTH domain
MTAFMQELKRLRAEHRLSQSKLADLASLDHSHISRLESGHRVPTVEVVRDLIRAMRLTPYRAARLMLSAGFVPEIWSGPALMDVVAERARQHSRWGVQDHSWPEWMLILTEEVGEAAQAANEAHWQRGDLTQMRDELIQVAAVAVQIVEAIDGAAVVVEEGIAA